MKLIKERVIDICCEKDIKMFVDYYDSGKKIISYAIVVDDRISYIKFCPFCGKKLNRWWNRFLT